MQGNRKIAVPEASPSNHVQNSVFAVPVSTSSARPAYGQRRVTAGIARKAGNTHKVSHPPGQIAGPAAPRKYSG